jgi:serine/threonine protein kinase
MAQDLTGTFIAEKYQLDSVLRGGFASNLYRATHRLMDKPFAIRVLHPHLAVDSVEVEKFFTRAKAEAATEHSGIPKVVDFGTDREGQVYVIYQAIAEDSLKSLISHDGQFPSHTAINVGRQIASALAAAHEGGFIHGNLTAENVLLSNTLEGGIVAQIVDFGSPNPIVADKENPEPFDFAYLSPEQCSGSDVSTEQTDIYSVGVIIYEMLAGVPPFTGEKPTEVMLKHLDEMPAPLVSFRPDVPNGVEPVILKALSKDPAMRHQSAAELAAELEALETSAPKATAAAAGNFWKTAVMMVFGIGLLAAALIYATSVKQTDPITSLQPDANGQPVQPLNPATGIEERNLASVPGFADANSNLSMPPGTLPGGDGYDPWANSRSLQPPGGTYNIPPDSQSPFTMDPGCTMLPSGLVICPTQAPAPNPTPTPRAVPPNSNTGTSPAATPRPQATPARTPAAPATNRPLTEDESN